MSSLLSPIEDAIKAIAAGQFVVVVDDEGRENEGDLIIAAEKATPDKIAFMIRHTSGIICVPMSPERITELDLPQMVQHNTEGHRTAFTVSVDYRFETTTGISASDRSKTILALAGHNSKPQDFARPGHIFPLQAKEGGVLRRAGHTEAAVDLAQLAGLRPAGAICELVNDDGTMQRLPELIEFAREHQMPIVSIADLISYRRKKEKLVQRLQARSLQTRYGEFQAYVYLSVPDNTQHLVLVKGEVDDGSDILVRVHNEHLVDDLLGTAGSCVLDTALQTIAAEGKGVLIYLRDGGNLNLSFYEQTDAEQTDTPERLHEWRENGIGSQILVDLGISRLRVLTNSNWRYFGLESYGLEIVEHVALGASKARDARS
ncbi:MAG: 3,4-dihydroxy-2-butanone-4-phosphate synthase [Candidatus Competibacteraceae bacterium]|nr:3,4-dihydroxy-2-butanone-4-phosphate synthase [Candidatus Competibacteraceae bacterium]MCB1805210.1 3,4-dihydroxy-2-butanone-4-phosphate synthase [Candidatus Competibacteraceae bacterium]MCB1814746.1 3,4-dihydroxy-2-butanone-4-phosphate synthase [Candidatus Competibacteraceae bacterium]